jgi:hypothetical protein
MLMPSLPPSPSLFLIPNLTPSLMLSLSVTPSLTPNLRAVREEAVHRGVQRMPAGLRPSTAQLVAFQ